MTGSKPPRTHAHVEIACGADHVQTMMHIKACAEPPLYELAPLVAPQHALLRCHVGMSVLDAWLMYELFWHTVAYEPP